MPDDTHARAHGTGPVPWYLPALNYWTPLYLAAGATAVLVPDMGIAPRVVLTLAWIYLLPPLLARAVLGALGHPEGCLGVETRGYARWWLLTQFQVMFNRFPALEEVLRTVPGLYSLWLRLWGARASVLAYWSPGVVVMDRYALTVGPGAVLGGGSRIGAHVVRKDLDGAFTLVFAPVVIEAGAVIGLHAAVGPGTRICAGESVPAGKLVRPFATWREGRQQRHPLEPSLTSRVHKAASTSPPATSAT